MKNIYIALPLAALLIGCSIGASMQSGQDDQLDCDDVTLSSLTDSFAYGNWVMTEGCDSIKKIYILNRHWRGIPLIDINIDTMYVSNIENVPEEELCFRMETVRFLVVDDNDVVQSGEMCSGSTEVIVRD